MRVRTLLIPSLALIAGSGVAQAADSLGLQIHGFASQGYVETDGEYYEDEGWYGRDTNKTGTFEFNEFAVNVMATPIDSLRIGVQLSAYDLGKYGNDQVAIDWAFGELQLPRVTDWLSASVVAGRFKTGHGFYNDYRDLDMTRTSVFLPRSTYTASFRDFFLAVNGGQLNGTIDAGPVGSLGVSGFIGTQNIPEDEGPIFDIFSTPFNGPAAFPPGSVNRLKSFDQITIEKMTGGHLEWDTPLEGLRLKGSFIYVHGWDAAGEMETITAGGATFLSDVDIAVEHWFEVLVGAEYQVGDLTLASEMSNNYYDADIVITPSAGPVTNVHLSQRTLGTYLSANYQLSFLPGAWNRLSVYGAGMWSRTADVSSDPDTKAYIRSAAVALRYDIAEHFLLKAEFERVQSTPAGSDHVYGNIFSLKTTFDF